MGEGKGKNYKVSTASVAIVLDNVRKLRVDLREFNHDHQFTDGSEMTDVTETNWPIPL